MGGHGAGLVPDPSSIAGTGGTDEALVPDGSRYMRWGGAGLVRIGWTRNRIGTEAVVNCRNRGH
ncbi:MAG: hypothetical protein Q8N94_02255 [Methanoregula sp.]|nr:hypothetical protein [Methanoregula sp.]